MLFLSLINRLRHWHHRKFNAGVLDTGGKLSLASSTPMANLPQVSPQIYVNPGKNETTGAAETGSEFVAGHCVSLSPSGCNFSSEYLHEFSKNVK
jgi:hypothetical protein